MYKKPINSNNRNPLLVDSKNDLELGYVENIDYFSTKMGIPKKLPYCSISTSGDLHSSEIIKGEESKTFGIEKSISYRSLPVDILNTIDGDQLSSYKKELNSWLESIPSLNTNRPLDYVPIKAFCALTSEISKLLAIQISDGLELVIEFVNALGEPTKTFDINLEGKYTLVYFKAYKRNKKDDSRSDYTYFNDKSFDIKVYTPDSRTPYSNIEGLYQVGIFNPSKGIYYLNICVQGLDPLNGITDWYKLYRQYYSIQISYKDPYYKVSESDQCSIVLPKYYYAYLGPGGIIKKLVPAYAITSSIPDENGVDYDKLCYSFDSSTSTATFWVVPLYYLRPIQYKTYSSGIGANEYTTMVFKDDDITSQSLREKYQIQKVDALTSNQHLDSNEYNSWTAWMQGISQYTSQSGEINLIVYLPTLSVIFKFTAKIPEFDVETYEDPILPVRFNNMKNILTRVNDPDKNANPEIKKIESRIWMSKEVTPVSNNILYINYIDSTKVYDSLSIIEKAIEYKKGNSVLYKDLIEYKDTRSSNMITYRRLKISELGESGLEIKYKSGILDTEQIKICSIDSTIRRNLLEEFQIVDNKDFGGTINKNNEDDLFHIIESESLRKIEDGTLGFYILAYIKNDSNDDFESSDLKNKISKYKEHGTTLLDVLIKVAENGELSTPVALTLVTLETIGNYTFRWIQTLNPNDINPLWSDITSLEVSTGHAKAYLHFFYFRVRYKTYQLKNSESGSKWEEQSEGTEQFFIATEKVIITPSLTERGHYTQKFDYINVLNTDGGYLTDTNEPLNPNDYDLGLYAYKVSMSIDLAKEDVPEDVNRTFKQQYTYTDTTTVPSISGVELPWNKLNVSQTVTFTLKYEK